MNEPGISQSKPSGNTKNAWPKHQLYRWVFTIKHEKYTESQLWSTLSQKATKFTFQLEKGEENDYLHYQGCFTLDKKEYFNTVKNWLGSTVHLECCNDWYASVNYCSKPETRVNGPWDQDSQPLNIIKDLYPWQQMVVDMLKEPVNDREIVWIYDEIGCKGKTALSKYLVVKYKALVITSGGTKDIAYLAKNKVPKIVIFNFARSKEDFVPYEGIESLKDGLITSTKYTTETLVFDPPHVVVFANFRPNTEKLSKDRWNIIEL